MQQRDQVQTLNNTQQQPGTALPQTGGLVRTYRKQQQFLSQDHVEAQEVPIDNAVAENRIATPTSSPDQKHPPSQFPDPLPSSQMQSSLLRPPRLFMTMKHGVRRWSGKIATVSGKVAALVGHTYQPAEPPMERYHPIQSIQSPVIPVQRRKSWKRSHTVRVSMQMRQRRMRWKRTQPGMGKIAYQSIFALLLFIFIGCFSGSAYGYTYYHDQLPRVQELAHRSISQTTRIYDRNGVPLYDVYDTGNNPDSGRRTPVAYKDIPQVMQDAMIAAEDHTFWTNSGVDPQGILRSSVAFLQHDSVQGGGSTITQQVIKNLTHDADVTLNRKIPEAALALGLTRQYPKWKILEMYFNVAPFGSNDLGIESAVEEYFHLEPQCDQHFACIPGVAQLDWNQTTKRHDPILALARASLLAGMPQKPVTDNPTVDEQHKRAALARQADVLNEMISLGMKINGQPITPTLAAQAERLMAQWTFTPYQHIKRAPHFVDWIVEQVETALGNGDPNKGYQAFITGGFNIRTTIDLNLETYVENAVKRHLTQPEYQRYTGDDGPLNVLNNVNDAAVVVINAHNGEILAMDGSADYYSNNPKAGGEFNVAAPPPNPNGQQPGRGPGSTFKPIIYATTFTMGWYPGMILPDFKTYFPKGSPAGTSIYSGALYSPPDYSLSGDPNYHHNTFSTIREATANSYNVPAMKAMEYAGPENVLTMAQRMGITTLTNDGIAWGLGTQNVPLIQMTSAYQTFADAGLHIPPQGILDIWDNYGHNLYHNDPMHPPAAPVLSPQVAYMMTSVLMDEPSRAIEFPGDHDLSFADKDPSCAYNRECPLQVAAKTGTTDNYVDNLTIGYTPNVVVGVWAGNADNSPMRHVTGITGAAPIWHSVMEFAAKGWCNQATDAIPCPPVDRASLHLDQPDTFPIPPGLHKAPTSALNGNQGSGVYDWVPDPMIPLQSGWVNTNPIPTITPTAKVDKTPIVTGNKDKPDNKNGGKGGKKAK